jgi:ADP-L-glycero-D-manno-heptose 6-epimerase
MPPAAAASVKPPMIIVTGGAGFIGSNLVAGLEDAGETDIVICDRLLDGVKWRNIAKRLPRDIIRPDELLAYVAAHADAIDTIFHLGANSSTTATDGDEIVATNFALSVALWRLCAQHGIGLIYASSAAVYGDGGLGFADSNDLAGLRTLRPLNLYGWSKWLFDGWVLTSIARDEPAPPTWAGLRFFNVYGPNEYHKGPMQSLVAKIVSAHQPGAAVQLFKSYRPEFADGWQLRDFIWVDDAVAVMLWLRSSGQTGGILNLGTGIARSFHDLASAAIRACGETPRIEYVDMPAAIRPAYQYYTCADVSRLAALGYSAPFSTLEAGVTRYVETFLHGTDRYR